MKWQNLIHQECPGCGRKLQRIKDRAIMYECTGGCGFLISERSLANTLADENHILRKYLTKEEKQHLTEALQKLYD